MVSSHSHPIAQLQACNKYVPHDVPFPIIVPLSSVVLTPHHAPSLMGLDSQFLMVGMKNIQAVVVKGPKNDLKMDTFGEAEQSQNL